MIVLLIEYSGQENDGSYVQYGSLYNIEFHDKSKNV